MNDTNQIFECLNATYASEDKKLNSVYTDLIGLLKTNEPERFEYIKKAQLSWIRLRDNDCAYDASADSMGDASGAADVLCQIRETSQRRADLSLRLSELKEHLQTK